jgi:hypothetical protein
MTFLAPMFLVAGGLISLGVVVLHLLVTQQPKSEDLPTVRFVPDIPARSTSLAIRPSDLWLLLLRIIMIMLIAAAFAQPQLKPEHKSIARITAVDVSRASGNMSELLDSARKYTAGAAAVVVFDSTAREVTPLKAMDSITALTKSPHAPQRNALSAGLITSLRAAARVRTASDSIDLVVVSPLLSAERDAATLQVRALWPGHVRTVRVSPRVDTTSATPKQKPRVEWADSGATTMWAARTHVDTIGALRAGDNVLVGTFVRHWQPNVKLDSATRVFARWIDGEPAGFERMTADGCIRSLDAKLPSGGDVALRPDYLRFTNSLSSPCGTSVDFTPLAADFMSVFEGPAQLAPTSAVKPQITRMTPLVPWLLLAALVLALLELLVRRSKEGSAAEADAAAAAEAERNLRKSGRAA